MITLRHRTASGGDPYSVWEYDPVRRILIATVRVAGALPVALEVNVCSEVEPYLGAFAIHRLSADVWQVEPAMFVRLGSHWVARGACYDARIPRESLALTHSPDDVSEELSRL